VILVAIWDKENHPSRVKQPRRIVLELSPRKQYRITGAYNKIAVGEGLGYTPLDS
jgi:hypothetical protein